MNVRRKVVAVLLVLAMVLSLLPAAALAVDTDPAATEVGTYAELRAALDAGGSIKLKNDLVTAGTIGVSDKDVAIDLDGHTLTVNQGNDFNNANVTISNGSVCITGASASGNALFCLGYTKPVSMTLNNVNVTGDGYSSAYAVFYLNGAGSALNINGGSVVVSNEQHGSGGVFKVAGGADYGTINITGTADDPVELTFTDAKIGFLDGTVNLKYVDLDITGGANAINQSAMTIENSTLDITGCDGRALTPRDGDIVVKNSALNFSDASEGEIRFKAGVQILLDETSSLAACGVYADASATGAKINDMAVSGTEENMDSVSVSDGVVTLIPVGAMAKIGNRYYTSLEAAVEAADTGAVVEILEAGTYTTNFKFSGGKNVTIQPAEGVTDVVLDGQLALLASDDRGGKTPGGLTLKNLTYNVENIKDSTGVSQTGSSGIALWGDQSIVCENVTFNMSVADSTAITGWWDTGIGTSITVKDCTFNCNGQRPIRSCGNVTVEGCTFNDPYRYAVQVTAKADTAELLEQAVVSFTNNIINNGEHGKAYVYGVQLEGADYGCHDLKIAGSGNTINAGQWDTENRSTLYYCECGLVDHDTVVWETEVPGAHEACYVVSFESAYATAPGVQYVEKDSVMILPTLSCEGYTLTGWKAGSETYPAGTEVKITADTTFVAQWNKIVPVEEKPDTVVQVEVAAGEATVAVAPELAQNETAADLAAALQQSEAVAQEDLEAAASGVVADSQALAAAAQTAQEQLGTEAPVTIVVDYYLDIQVTGVELAENGAQSVALDITPMYQLMATTNSADMTQENTVLIGKAQEMAVTKPVTITLPLPDGFVSSTDSDLYIRHVKEDGTVYVYKAEISELDGAYYATFVNPNGFSTFVLTTETAASITVDKQTTYYDTLAEAIAAVQDGQTIKLEKNNAESVVISEVISFTLDTNGKEFTGEIKAGDGYVLSKGETVEGKTVYTVSVKPDEPVDEECDGGENCPSRNFTDVDPTRWYHEAIDYVVEHNLMNGMSPTTFEPDTKTNRAMLVTVLYRMEGSPAVSGNNPFTDAQTGYYANAVVWASENNVTNGMTATTFEPKRDITREQMVTFLYRYAAVKGIDTSARADLSSFADADQVSNFAKNAMSWAVATGIISGNKVDGKVVLDAKGNATRAQIATVLMRYCELP